MSTPGPKSFRIVPLDRPITPAQRMALEEWLAALRSGWYLQGKMNLFRQTLGGRRRHCCLGVASVVCLSATTPQDTKRALDGTLCNLRFNGGLDSIGDYPPPLEFAATFGFRPTRVLAVRGMVLGGRQCSLPSLNDEQGLTFSQIADVIEAACIRRQRVTLTFP